jgi:hypothetical protein
MKVMSAMHSGQIKRFNSNVLWAVFGIGLVIVWLLLWEWSVRFGLSRQFVVPPSELIVLLYQSLFVSGELRPHLWASDAARWWICNRSRASAVAGIHYGS